MFSAFSKLAVGPKSRKPKTQRMHVEPSRRSTRSVVTKKLQQNQLERELKIARAAEAKAKKEAAAAAREVKAAKIAKAEANNANFANAFSKMGL
jgi:hypothetical protein